MSQIFYNATLNISADVGADSRTGCFVDRDELDVTPLGIFNPELKRSWAVTPHPIFLPHPTQEAPTYSRAWVRLRSWFNH